MSCQTITSKLIEVAELSQQFDRAMKSRQVPVSLELKKHIDEEIDGTKELIADIKMEVRKLIAEKHSFDFVGEFHEGLAWADKGSEKVLVNNKGEIVKKFKDKVTEAYRFVNGTALIEIEQEVYDEFGEIVGARTEKKYRLVDTTGEKIFDSLEYDSLSGDPHQRILCLGSSFDDFGRMQYNFVDRISGQEFWDKKPVSSFACGVAWEFEDYENEKNDRINLVNEKFERLNQKPIIGKSIGSFSSGYGVVKTPFDEFEIYDTKGKLINTLTSYLKVGQFYEGRSWAQTEDGKHQLIDIFGHVYFEDETGLHGVVNEGFALMHGDGFAYFIDRNGDKKLPKEKKGYIQAEPFSEGLAVVTRFDGRYTFVDHEGDRALGLYSEAKSFDQGVAKVKVGGDTFHIDHKGRKVF